MKALKIYVLILGLVLSTFALSAPASADSNNKQRILETLHALRNSVNNSHRRLRIIGDVHEILSHELGDHPPSDLAAGIVHELNILIALQEDNEEYFLQIIDAEQLLAEGKNVNSLNILEVLNAMVTQLLEKHQTIDKILATESEGRKAFKKRLNGVLDGLAVANPNKAGTYAGIKAVLDPEVLNLEYETAQRPILAGLISVLKELE